MFMRSSIPFSPWLVSSSANREKGSPISIFVADTVYLFHSRSVLCVQLPEGFGNKLEIVCIENRDEFNDFFKEPSTALCRMSFPQPV